MTSLGTASNATRTLKVGTKTYVYYSLPVAEKNGLKGISRLPFSMKVLLENLLRNEDGRSVSKEDIQACAQWLKTKLSEREIAFRPARVLMQDFTGVPAVVDLAAMRDAMKNLGGEAKRINPLVPVDLVNEIAQTTLDNIRTLSQALHPVMLDEAGFESTVDWYIPTVEKQNGIAIHYEKSGAPYPVNGSTGIHMYRILQEALNNVARHSESAEAWVRLRFLENALELEVEDHGKGFALPSAKPAIGLVAMRERAELLGGTLTFTRPPQGGTLVRLKVQREKQEPHAE